MIFILVLLDIFLVESEEAVLLKIPVLVSTGPGRKGRQLLNQLITIPGAMLARDTCR